MTVQRIDGWVVVLAACVALGLAGEASAAAPAAPQAPEIRSSHWLNSAPLRAEDLRGKVRLVEFWAFRCINCVRTVPAMRTLAERFRGDVVVIGVHTPELDDERDLQKLTEALRRLDVRYPVATDNDYALWRAYGNRYWPALYLVDKRGRIRTTHIGELHQGTPEWTDLLAKIEALRREPG
jgi:thiol-disulfide isomerase/thioredoxin